ncbi:Hypp215 [Branchiostoma lanceolatum]|uniref:Hypp215 protein n=1 Tax=Branchiostoma lanceolatum TaxID=7740 RepID=A0A8J9VKF9_BRALA|nr:Hypp215 [Branchiostoma lanceolatum]
MTERNAGPAVGFFSLPAFLNGLLGAAALLVGTLLICAISLTIRYIYKRWTRKTPSGQASDHESDASITNTNLPATVSISGQVQTGQGRYSLATSTGEYEDAISPLSLQISQSGQRQHLYRSDEQGYQIPFAPPPSTNGDGSQAVYQNVSTAHGADTPDHYYGAVSD